MDFETKERLTRHRDMGKEAHAVRMIAARRAIGLEQQDVASGAGVSPQLVNHMERARQFPNRQVMAFFHREHRIDFDYLMHGDYQNLPDGLRDKIFAELQRLETDAAQEPK